MRLYTIPYAGGFSFTYHKWKHYLHREIDLCPVEFPGRGMKAKEPVCQTIEQMADNVLNQIDTEGAPYALFGHSMGAYVLLELYTRIQEDKKTLPKYIIISAMRPPHLYNPRGYHLLDDDLFQQKICEMGGVPLILTEDIKFSEYVFSLMRNDFRAVENYVTSNRKAYISTDVSLFNSEEDIAYTDMIQWNQYTRLSCEYYEFEGTHFFINERVYETVSTINRILGY